MNWWQSLLWSAVIVPASACLGKVWATRISNREQAKLAEDLEFFKARFEAQSNIQKNELETQRTLLTQTYSRVLSGESIILPHQIKAIDVFWKCWQEIKHVSGKYVFPHRLAIARELAKPEIRKRFASF